MTFIAFSAFDPSFLAKGAVRHFGCPAEGVDAAGFAKFINDDDEKCSNVIKTTGSKAE